MTTVVISNDEIHDIIKIVKSHEDSGLLVKGITETVLDQIKEQKGGFLSMLLGTLGASSLGNMLTGEVIIKPGYGSKDLKSEKGK